MNQIERDMVVDIGIAKELMEEAIRSYKVSKDRYYAYIASTRV